MIEYSQAVQELNKDLKTIEKPSMNTISPDQYIAMEMRQRMLEYGKHVPKPKLPRIIDSENETSNFKTIDNSGRNKEVIKNPVLYGFNMNHEA